MFTKAFALATAERAAKTFAQTLIATLGAGVINIVHVAWVTDLEVSAGATLLSVLTSVVTAKTTGGNPSMGSVEKVTP